jgi:hypothetical protein
MTRTNPSKTKPRMDKTTDRKEAHRKQIIFTEGAKGGGGKTTLPPYEVLAVSNGSALPNGEAIWKRSSRESRPKAGSTFSGGAENSDLDVLIVAGDEVENTRRESDRLRGALKEIEMPIDIVVVRESTFQKLSDTPGLIYEEARRIGLLVYERES